MPPPTHAFIESRHRGDVSRKQHRTERDHPETKDWQKAQQTAKDQQYAKQNSQCLGDPPEQPVVALHAHVQTLVPALAAAQVLAQVRATGKLICAEEDTAWIQPRDGSSS